ncbi:MAG: MFS transporter [Clostridia bacterium]
MQAKKLSFSRKLSFALCDIFGGGSFNIINFLYPGFLAVTVGLSAYHIGLVMLIARVWDAVSDPLMGYLSDATRSRRFGKRRIYLVIAAPLVLLAMFLMFFPWPSPSIGVRFAGVLFSYIFFCTVQTMVMIPYYSLSSEISSDYRERASANGLRLGFSIFSSILCVAVPGMIVSAYEGSQGYIAMSLLFGAVFALSVLLTGLFAREEIVTPPIREKPDLRKWLEYIKVRPFRHYLGMMLCLQLTMSIMSALFFFYVDYYLRADITSAGGTTLLGTLSAALMFGMQIVALPIYLKMIEKKGKAQTYCFGAILWIVSALSVLLTTPATPDWAVYLLAAVMGFAISAPGLVPHTMFGDVVDVVELSTGRRAEGAMGGVVNLLVKTVQGFGLAGVMAIMGAFGFRESQYVNGVLDKVLSQPTSAQHAIQWCIALSPALLMTLGILIARKYRVTRQKQGECAALLKQPERQAEREALLKELGA